MSFKIVKVVVSKGRTIADEKSGKWERQQYTVELEISDERDVQQAKAAGETVVDGWLDGSTHVALTQQAKTEQKPRWNYDAEKIVWVERDGPKGKFQLARPEDNVNNSDFAVLIEALKTQSPVHGKNFLFWLMQDGKAAARKPKAK